MTLTGCRSIRIGSDSVCITSARKLVIATVIWSGASLTPATKAASGLSSSITRGRPRAASRTAPIGARDDQSVVEKERGDRRDGGRTEVGPIGDLDPRDRPEAADRVHDMEAIDRAHQFGIGGLHFDGRSAGFRAILLSGSAIYCQWSGSSTPCRSFKGFPRLRTNRLDSDGRLATHLIRITE